MTDDEHIIPHSLEFENDWLQPDYESQMSANTAKWLSRNAPTAQVMV